jgi:hypothetical protein
MWKIPFEIPPGRFPHNTGRILQELSTPKLTRQSCQPSRMVQLCLTLCCSLYGARSLNMNSFSAPAVDIISFEAKVA